VFVADYDASYPADVRFETYETLADQKDNRPDLAGFHVAFIPAATKAQALQMVKAHKFLAMTRDEQVEAIAVCMTNDPEYADSPRMRLIVERDAKRLLATLYGEAKP
jgi:hypothetical protein